jgi:hypothetical protein
MIPSELDSGRASQLPSSNVTTAVPPVIGTARMRASRKCKAVAQTRPQAPRASPDDST